MLAQSNLKQISLVFIFIFFILGVSISGTIASGDELGRVNLLHFIGLFVLWPFISFLLLIILKFLPNQHSSVVIKTIVNLPLWSQKIKTQFINLKRDQRFNAWLVLQSQLSVLAFSVGCLISFLMVLLFSDIAFVWRSTLLKSNHILPILEFIALPWSMFDVAQPAQWLVDTTQENRMAAFNPTNNPTSNSSHGMWWQFLLLAQITYAVVPRLLSTLFAFISFKRLPVFEHSIISSNESPNRVIKSPVLSNVLTQRPTFEHYNVCCWLAMNDDLLAQIISRFAHQPNNTYQVGFHGNDEKAALLDKTPQLLLVAAWEPPMGELKDYLEQGKGVVMLIDHKEGIWQPIGNHYIDEWRRFCATLEHWSLFVDKDLL